MDLLLEGQTQQLQPLVLEVGAGGTSYVPADIAAVRVDLSYRVRPDVVCDLHQLPFRDASFRGVVGTQVLEHVRSPERVVRESARVLSSGGVVILATPFLYPRHDLPHDYFRFSEAAYEILLNNFFGPVLSKSYGGRLFAVLELLSVNTPNSSTLRKLLALLSERAVPLPIRTRVRSALARKLVSRPALEFPIGVVATAIRSSVPVE